MRKAKTSEPTDEQLMIDLQAGDAGCLAIIMARHERAVKLVIYGMVKDYHMAEDIAQETFLKVYTRRDSFRLAAQFKPWLMTIAANSARDHLRTVKRRRTGTASVPDFDGEDMLMSDVFAATTEASDAPILRHELGDQVKAAVTRLGDAYSDGVVLKYMEGLSQKDVARILEIPQGTVKSRCFLGMKQVRRDLFEYLLDK